MERFLWGVYPYICITLFFVIPVIRMAYRPFGWTTRASGIFGHKMLGLASLCLHWGLGLLFIGHLAGLFGGLLGLDAAVTAFYWIGLVGGLMALFGSSLALYRRLTNPEVRAMSHSDDYIVHAFLIAIIGLALYQVLVDHIFGVAYPAAAWFGSLWRLSPQPEHMMSASLLSKLHVFLALTFFAYFPFTKLVHVWSYPINYAVRSYQSMRTQTHRFQRQWEFGLKSDKSWMVLGMAVLVATFVGAGLLLGQTLGDSISPSATQKMAAAPMSTFTEMRGYPLYVSACARCHGTTGQGDGPGADSPTFANRPRDLVAGDYLFTSTANGVASDADLRRVLEHGLPGSGMPAFDFLSDPQIDSLVAVLDALWEERPAPGPRFEPPPPPKTDDDTIALGKSLYAKQCAVCHGDSGGGDGPTADGMPVRPADLTTGQLKGGASRDALYRRVHQGITASGMAAFGEQLTSEQIWAVIDFLEAEVIPDDALDSSSNVNERRSAER